MRTVRAPEILHRAQPQIAEDEGRFTFISSADIRRELFNLHADPGELENLIRQKPQ